MGKFGFNGVDAISASVAQLASLSNEEKLGLLEKGAEVVVNHHKEKIRSTFMQRTGALAESITAEPRSGKDGNPTFVVYPKGKHPGSATGARISKGRKKGSYDGTNAEVLYVLNYGSSRISPTHVVENANDEAMPEFESTLGAAWDELLKSKGL